MIYEWKNISKLEGYRKNFEFSEYVVLIRDEDCHYIDIASGIDSIPAGTERFCLVPEDVEE